MSDGRGPTPVGSPTVPREVRAAASAEATLRDPEEVTEITVSRVLPAASSLNGAVIPVDWGLTVQNT